MNNSKEIFINAAEMSEMLGISEGHAYKLIRQMNKELSDKGFLVIAGKVPRDYFAKRWYTNTN